MLIEHRRSQSLVQEADAKFRSAYYDDALDLLEGCEDWDAPVNEDAVLLKAEILTRRNPLASLQELANSQDVFQTPRGMFRYFLGLGAGYALTRNFEAAEAMFRKARKMLKGGEADLLPQVALQEARLRWMMGDSDPESVDVIHALQDKTAMGKMAALLNRGWRHADSNHYDRQIVDCIAALKIAQEQPDECDAFVVGRVVHALLRVAMETGDEAAVGVGQRAFEGLAWTPDIQVEQFQAVRVLGWFAFLSGEAIRAQRYFKVAQALAPSKAWEVTAHLDRAHVASINNNELWAMEETFEADRIAKDVAWATTRGEERISLATLAVMMAKIDMAKAQTYIGLYNQLGSSSIDPNLVVSRDRRAVAAERYAAGCVQRTLGNTELATTLLEEAYTVFNGAGHHHRAALAAVVLFEITGASQWQERGQVHGSHFARSPVSAAVERAASEPDDEIFKTLTPSQKQVLAAICEGLSVAEMAERFSRSVFTINKHIQAVYGAFDVHSRNELRAEAKKRRLFGQVWASSLDSYIRLVKS